jgi:hypothetical protein
VRSLLLGARSCRQDDTYSLCRAYAACVPLLQLLGCVVFAVNAVFAVASKQWLYAIVAPFYLSLTLTGFGFVGSLMQKVRQLGRTPHGAAQANVGVALVGVRGSYAWQTHHAQWAAHCTRCGD